MDGFFYLFTGLARDGSSSGSVVYPWVVSLLVDWFIAVDSSFLLVRWSLERDGLSPSYSQEWLVS
jgi:hypothetical protein